MAKQPVFFLPHGGGPCFFMDDPTHEWTALGGFLSQVMSTLPERPKAILVVSGHWETRGFGFTAKETPDLIFDYYGFPRHTYALTFPVPGDPALAKRAADLLSNAGLKGFTDPVRGLDHGVFVPLKVVLPDADIPVVEMSVEHTLDPALHIAAGKALAPLRDEGVLIVGSGMSFHNMRGFGDPRFTQVSRAFADWLTGSVALAPDARAAALSAWDSAPFARLNHPREEHLLPLMVAAGASDGPGTRVYSGLSLATELAAFRFDA